ncbi:MAG: TonB-dependent receptor plug domain-containing protein [Candidatus Marinimicrobia bacterium]|nr:TonB-dependent receptor plug domain-containing protein [Candidatus Neomarinimicrobiota bacterium]
MEHTLFSIYPGTYTLSFIMIGYGELRVTNVEVQIDFTTKVDAALSVEALQSEEVTVVAERPMIQKDLTSSTSVVGSREMENLPVTEVGEVLSMQAGYVDGSLRGGRRGEVMYMIDGVPMTDSYDRSSTVDINTSMIQELQVISGAFNAEYGQAMSGIVNIATKQGSNDFGGHANFYIGDHISTHSEIFPRVNRIQPFSINNLELGIHGPLIRDKLFYYLNARRIYYDGHNKGQKRYTPVAYADEFGDRQVALVDSSTMLGSGEWVDMGWNRKNYLQGQLIYRIGDKSRIAYNMIYDDRKYQDFDRSWKYNPDGLGTNELIGQTHIVKYQRQLSQRSFYDLAYTYGKRHYERYYDHFDIGEDDDSLLVHPDLRSTFPYQFHIGGTQNNWNFRDSWYHLLKFNFSSQISRAHQIKLGVELKQNGLQWEAWEYRPKADEEAFNVSDPYITPTRLADTTVYSSSFAVDPREFSAFIQDKIEYEDFIVNVGVRLDYFNPDYVVLSDPEDPDIYNPIKPDNRFNDLNGNGEQDAGEASKSIEDRRQYWYEGCRSKAGGKSAPGFFIPDQRQRRIPFQLRAFFPDPELHLFIHQSEFSVGERHGTSGNDRERGS